MYSAMKGIPVPIDSAYTGEVSIRGEICPVGGVDQKIRAAEQAGLSKVYIPQANWQERYAAEKVHIIPVTSLADALGVLDSPAPLRVRVVSHAALDQ
jgi:Lon-like ATP-dependent protease